MREFCQLLFDDTITGNATAYTDAPFNELLGSADHLTFQLIADDAAGSAPTIKAALQHSSDGQRWADKNTNPEVPRTALGPVTNVLKGADNSGNSSLARGRVAITTSGTTTSVHAKLYACGIIN